MTPRLWLALSSGWRCRLVCEPPSALHGQGNVITGTLNAPVLMMAEKIADKIRGILPLPPSTARFHQSGSSPA
jgi:hypothetical protein